MSSAIAFWVLRSSLDNFGAMSRFKSQSGLRGAKLVKSWKIWVLGFDTKLDILKHYLSKVAQRNLFLKTEISSLNYTWEF